MTLLTSLRLWIVDQLTGWLDRHHESAAWDYTEPTPDEQAAIDRVWANVQRQLAADTQRPVPLPDLFAEDVAAQDQAALNLTAADVRRQIAAEAARDRRLAAVQRPVVVERGECSILSGYPDSCRACPPHLCEGALERKDGAA